MKQGIASLLKTAARWVLQGRECTLSHEHLLSPSNIIAPEAIIGAVNAHFEKREEGIDSSKCNTIKSVIPENIISDVYRPCKFLIGLTSNLI